MVCALQEMDRLHVLIDELNVQMYNPMGLHIRWPREVAFLFVSRFFPVCAMVSRLTAVPCLPHCTAGDRVLRMFLCRVVVYAVFELTYRI